MNKIGNTESVLREAVMTTPAGRRWRREFLREARRRRREEAKLARRARPKPEWGMSGGGSGYERDEVRRHGVKVKSFKADLRRKLKLRKATGGSESERAARAIRAFDEAYRGPSTAPPSPPARPSLFPKLGRSHAGRDLQRRRSKDARKRVDVITDPKRLASKRGAERKRAEIERKLRKRAAKVKVAFESIKAGNAIRVFDAAGEVEREAAARRGDRRLLREARRAARFVEAAASRSGLSPALRREIEGLRDEVLEILRSLGRPAPAAVVDRGRGLGNDTSNLRPGDAEGEAADGEISKLLMEPEGTRGAGRDDGMGGDSLYEDRCDECGEAAEACECEEDESSAMEAQDWDDTGMDGDAAEEPDVDEEIDSIDEETGAERGDGKRSKVDVNYRYAGDQRRRCGNCRFFAEPAACEVVNGAILKVDVCDLWAPRGAR